MASVDLTKITKAIAGSIEDIVGKTITHVCMNERNNAAELWLRFGDSGVACIVAGRDWGEGVEMDIAENPYNPDVAVAHKLGYISADDMEVLKASERYAEKKAMRAQIAEQIKALQRKLEE